MHDMSIVIGCAYVANLMIADFTPEDICALLLARHGLQINIDLNQHYWNNHDRDHHHHTKNHDINNHNAKNHDLCRAALLNLKVAALGLRTSVANLCHDEGGFHGFRGFHGFDGLNDFCGFHGFNDGRVTSLWTFLHTVSCWGSFTQTYNSHIDNALWYWLFKHIYIIYKFTVKKKKFNVFICKW